MPKTSFTFNNAQGQPLCATLELPNVGEPRHYAIFAHCFTCNKNLNAVRHIAQSLQKAGIAVLSFDFTGLGRSEGKFVDTNFSTNIEDLCAAATYLAKTYKAPELLIGHSLGGAAVLAAATKIDSVKAIATIGAPYAPNHVTHLFSQHASDLESDAPIEVDIGGRPFMISKQFFNDLNTYQPETYLPKLKTSIAIFHSPQDSIVDINNASDIYTQLKHPKSFISLDGADHLLTNTKDSLYVGHTISQWASRYLDVDEIENEPTNTDVQVSLHTDNGFTCEVNASGHLLIADEPLSFGGSNLGPSPYDYLLSGLGACTVMTLHMYAKHKKWPLEKVRAHLTHEKRHASDCNNCEQNKDSKVDVITREINIIGELNNEQREALLRIADRCPVHKTLESKILINTITYAS